jgi:hypothetical protein
VGEFRIDGHLLTTCTLGYCPPVFSTTKALKDVEDSQGFELAMSSSRQRRHTALLNDIPVDILDALTQSDLSVLNYLDRLAQEVGGGACTASIPKIAMACKISARQVQLSVGRLVAAHLVEKVGYDLSNADRRKRGTIYKVLTAKVPEERGLSRREAIRVMGLVVDACIALHHSIGQLAQMLQTPARRRRTEALLRRLSKDVRELVEVLNGDVQ